MELKELITAVKEKSLTKTQLEGYRDSLSNIFAQIQFELAEIEKKGALFFDAEKQLNPEATDISIKRKWKATKEGLREIELKRYAVATKEILNSLKSRLYSIY